MKALDLFVSCEEDAEFTYYDDDGWSKEYEEGNFAETKISVKAGDRKQIHFIRMVLSGKLGEFEFKCGK